MNLSIKKLFAFLFFLPFFVSAQMSNSECLFTPNHSETPTPPENNTRDCDEEGVYIIPVVFHVLYNSDIDNISEEQIVDGLAELNKRFRKLNADTVEIIAPFVDIAADAKIEFRLAQLDPDGNPTNGITRKHTDSLAFDHFIHAYHDSTGGTPVWPIDMYLNIHVVKEFAGILGGGRGTTPTDDYPEYQGIIITNNMIGAIGTGVGSTTFTHEAGHFFNLYHIWAYLGTPGDEANCSNDDGVADTPNCFGSSYIYGEPAGLWAESCGSLDNVQNYMTYSPSFVKKMFTLGQVERMHTALNSPVGGRNNLHTIENLIATGICDASGILKLLHTDFVIYPNPANTFVKIQSQNESIKQVQIFDLSGKLVLTINGFGKSELILPVADFKKGIYLVQINENKHQKIIIQ